MDRAWPSFMAPPLSSPSTRKICSAVRCWISCATSSAGRPPMRLPNPSAVRPASPTGSVASFAVRAIAGRGGSSTTSIVGRGADRGYTAFARWLPRPLYQIADRQHGGYQVPQRPGEIGLGDHDHAVVQAKVTHGAARHRTVG